MRASASRTVAVSVSAGHRSPDASRAATREKSAASAWRPRIAAMAAISDSEWASASIRGRHAPRAERVHDGARSIVGVWRSHAVKARDRRRAAETGGERRREQRRQRRLFPATHTRARLPIAIR